MSYYLTESGVDADTTTIVVGGELDTRAAPALREALERASDAGVTHVIVDLTDTTFIDSTAIGALLWASKQVGEAAGELQVVCTNRNVLGIFEIAGLDHFIRVSQTHEEALQAAAMPAELRVR